MILPDRILKRMEATERAKLGKAGLLASECKEMAVAKSERELQGMLVNLLRLNDVKFVLNQRFGVKTTAPKGTPDIVFAINGIPCAWEIKMPGEKPRAEQVKAMAEMTADGWRCDVVTSVPQALELIKLLRSPVSGAAQDSTHNTMQKQLYVAGFMFDTSFERVALIRKNKPAWQAGKLNGIGGKVEDGETELLAMVREFAEETATETSVSQWSHFADMGADAWCVSFFATQSDLSALRTNEEEPIEIVSTRDFNPLCEGAIENLPWLIALAIDHLQDGRPRFTEIHYPS